MNRPRILLGATVLFWIVVSGVVIRTNRLWLSPVTFRWTNLTQPNATFRWTVAPTEQPVTLLPHTTRSLKVRVPRKFSTGTLSITTTSTSGGLVVNINAPADQPNITGHTDSRGTVSLPLSWTSIAVQTRTFNVDVMTDAEPATITGVTLKLNHP